MSWDGVESLIGRSFLFFLIASLLLWIPPRRFLPAIGIVALGWWVIFFRFTGDMGQAHFSGGFLGLGLFVYCASWAVRSSTGRK
jgi:hypothetical protein